MYCVCVHNYYTDVIDDYNADDGDSNSDHGDDDSDDDGSGNDDDGGDNNADYDDHNDDPDKGSNKSVPGVVLAAALLCTLLLSFAIIFTMIVFIWWKLQTNSEWLLNTIESTIDTYSCCYCHSNKCVFNCCLQCILILSLFTTYIHTCVSKGY